MYGIIEGKLHGLNDEAPFIETLSRLDQSPRPEVRGFFDPGRELIVTRAPGRLDVMGGIADYSGSLVLQLPIEEAIYVALQPDPSPTIKIVTLHEDKERESAFEMPLADFDDGVAPVDYQQARARFQSDPSHHWAAYVAGVFLVLMRERAVRFCEGARILISSRVPEGKGVSSSAALEVAVMQAAAAFDVAIDPLELAGLCQMVENLVVGAPCGIMDQMTASCGEANRLLALLCQPAELKGMITIPDNVAFWGLDSGERHAVTGADYSSVRVGAFMGRRIVADLSGTADSGESWDKCLANLAPSEFEHRYARHLPEQISGKEFTARYQSTVDTVTRIDPERTYAVRAPAAHPVYENHRVKLFAEMIGDAGTATRLELLGELMYQSHASYSACGLGSKGTDLLVRLVREAGPGSGLFGARITGGGSGGTVAVLGRPDAGPSIAELADKYAGETGYRPYVFSGSSPGSAAFGHLRLKSS